ncbi:MAG: hypothetical protein GX989_00615 [Firmicutes bacterium]|nr:hypothetical protein [Bacillota bacterium]
MGAQIKRKIETREPIQWAIDFLEEMICFQSEENIEPQLWEQLLKEKKRELLEDFFTLTPSIALFHQGLGYSEGLDGGRILAMRILMDILPPYRALGCNQGKPAVGIVHRLKIFQEAIVYLKSLHLTDEGDRTLWKNSFFSAVKMLLRNNYSPYLFHRGGRPVFIVAPPYREKTAACYLLNPHVIVLYSLPEKNIAKRIYLVLHEIGHLIFGKYMAGKPLPETLLALFNSLDPRDFPELIRPSSQGLAEIFANLFALAIMRGTKEGNELFYKQYNKMRDALLLLRKAFHPDSIFQITAIEASLEHLTYSPRINPGVLRQK